MKDIPSLTCVRFNRLAGKGLGFSSSCENKSSGKKTRAFQTAWGWSSDRRPPNSCLSSPIGRFSSFFQVKTRLRVKLWLSAWRRASEWATGAVAAAQLRRQRVILSVTSSPETTPLPSQLRVLHSSQLFTRSLHDARARFILHSTVNATLHGKSNTRARVQSHDVFGTLLDSSVFSWRENSLCCRRPIQRRNLPFKFGRWIHHGAFPSPWPTSIQSDPTTSSGGHRLCFGTCWLYGGVLWDMPGDDVLSAEQRIGTQGKVHGSIVSWRHGCVSKKRATFGLLSTR